MDIYNPAFCRRILSTDFVDGFCRRTDFVDGLCRRIASLKTAEQNARFGLEKFCRRPFSTKTNGFCTIFFVDGFCRRPSKILSTHFVDAPNKFCRPIDQILSTPLRNFVVRSTRCCRSPIFLSSTEKMLSLIFCKKNKNNFVDPLFLIPRGFQ